MDKSVQIYIQIDDVPLQDIEALQDRIEEAISEYADKRVTMTIQDEPLVRPSRR